MNNFTKDFPFIFDAIFILAVVVEVLILVFGSRNQFSFDIFIQSYKDVSKSIYFLPWIGLVVNVIFYLLNLDDGWILAGCLSGIVGFMILAVLPEFFYAGLIFLLIGICLFYRSLSKRRQRIVNHAETK